MHRFTSIGLACFGTALVALAGDGVPPRADISSYAVHRDAQNATVAATPVAPELARKIFPSEVQKNFYVMEVAVFPLAGQTADVDSFDFQLKFSSDEVSYPRAPQEIVAMWMEKNAPQPPSKVDVTTETGVVYQSSNDPVYGRSKGWGTYSSVGVSPGQPTPPRPLSQDPQDVEANLRARALPEGPVARPVAGYLYFPLPSKKRKNAALELQYLKDGVLVTLPIPGK